MKEARYFLVVHFSVEPPAEAPLLRWLDLFEKHMRVERFCGEVEASYAA